MKVIRRAIIVFLTLLVSVFLPRNVGRFVHDITPINGICESMYVKVGDDVQWINIYGKNKYNPVMLYLHGGPGESTSTFDYKILRKFSDIYTIVTWDQRCCGKSYNAKSDKTVLTKDLFMQDGKEITEYILEYMSVDKITLMGHSWGSIYGANLALAYPEYYNCFIGCGQLVDVVENEIAFKEVAQQWATDEKGQDLVDKLTPERLTMEHFDVKNKILEKYGYHMLANGRDYNLFFARYFNPFYSVLDYAKYSKANNTAYETFIESEEFLSFSLKDKYKYAVPFFNVNGDKDFQANYLLANEYFKNVQAPRKNMFLMKNMTHGLLESNSEEFESIIREIYELMQYYTAQ